MQVLETKPETDEFAEHEKEYQEAEREIVRQADDEGGTPNEEAQPESSEEQTEEQRQTVPLSTFLDQKRSAKEANQRLSALQTELSTLKEQLAQLKPKEAIPDREEDPFGYIDHTNKELRSMVESIGEKLENFSKQEQAQNFQTHVQGLERSFAEAHPDYWDAIEFLKKSRVEEYAMMGVDEDQALQIFNQDAAYVLHSSVQNGRNPAEVAYQLAKGRGFQVKPDSETNGATPQSNGTRPESLKAIAKRQEAAQTLSGKGGKAAKDELEIEDINKLSDEKFDEMFLGKAGDKRLKQLMQ